MKKSELKNLIKEVIKEANPSDTLFHHFKDFILTILQDEEENEFGAEAMKDIEKAEDIYILNNIIEEVGLDFMEQLNDFLTNPRTYNK